MRAVRSGSLCGELGRSELRQMPCGQHSFDRGSLGVHSAVQAWELPVVNCGQLHAVSPGALFGCTAGGVRALRLRAAGTA